MDTDIRYLDLLEQDLRQAAGSRRCERPHPRTQADGLAEQGDARRRLRRRYLVVAGLIGWLVPGSVCQNGARAPA